MRFFKPLKAHINALARQLHGQLPGAVTVDHAHSIDIKGTPTPVLRNGSSILNLDFSLPDAFQKKTGATSTFFVRVAQDFVRVTTSVTRPNGERPLGTPLDRAHPGYKELLAGRAVIKVSVAEVDEGSKLADQAGVAMTSLLESVRSVAGIMAEMSTGRQAQRSSIEELNQSIGNLDDMTQQKAALVEEAAAAAENLHRRADELSSVVQVFKLGR